MSFRAGLLGKTLRELVIDEDMLAHDDESKGVLSTTLMELVKRNRKTYLGLYGRRKDQFEHKYRVYDLLLKCIIWTVNVIYTNEYL